jgi:hypothetical protein
MLIAGAGLMAACLDASAFAQARSATATIAQPIPDDDEIVVHGRRNEQYRIPPALRQLPADRSERWRRLVNRQLGCEHVGPRGCGPNLLRILTINSGGDVRVGDKKGGE